MHELWQPDARPGAPEPCAGTSEPSVAFPAGLTDAHTQEPSVAHGRVTALVPLRSVRDGKARLGDRLSRAQRGALVRHLFAHVVGVLRAAGSVDRTIVAAGDESATEFARHLRVASVRDPLGGGGLNVALRSIIARLPPDDHLLIIVPDLPDIAAPDVDELFATPGGIRIAPTSDGGTGGLVLGPAARIRPQYGPQSARRHLAAGRAAGHTTSFVWLDGFGLDVDTPHDLAAAGRVHGRLLSTSLGTPRRPREPAGR